MFKSNIANKNGLHLVLFIFSSLLISFEATAKSTCIFESPEIGTIKAHADYETALEKVSSQCLAKRSEILRERHSNLSREDFKDRQVEFADDCVNKTKCTGS